MAVYHHTKVVKRKGEVIEIAEIRKANLQQR